MALKYLLAESNHFDLLVSFSYIDNILWVENGFKLCGLNFLLHLFYIRHYKVVSKVQKWLKQSTVSASYCKLKKLTDCHWWGRVASSHYTTGSHRHSHIFTTELRHWRLTPAVCSVVLQLMVACAITAFCPTHNTGSIKSTRTSGIGEFIVDVLSISTVLRNGHIVLSEHRDT